MLKIYPMYIVTRDGGGQIMAKRIGSYAVLVPGTDKMTDAIEFKDNNGVLTLGRSGMSRYKLESGSYGEPLEDYEFDDFFEYTGIYSDSLKNTSIESIFESDEPIDYNTLLELIKGIENL